MIETAFPIIGIGTSAGGLAALEAFFSGLSPEVKPNMAFIVVQHLDPSHKSLLSEILSKHTKLPVFEAKEGMKVQINCVYTKPPDQDILFKDGALHLLEQSKPHNQNHPIDTFFGSLAENLSDAANGIILSGMGSDGTQGIQDISNASGLTIAQSPVSAEYSSMPDSAIATGHIDCILAPNEMIAKLISIHDHTHLGSKSLSDHKDTTAIPVMRKIFALLRSQTGHDFTQYKPSSIQRRLERRLTVCRIKCLDEYLSLLQTDPQEIHLLFSDLLIGVTSFFRDPSTFKHLEEQVIPSILQKKQDADTIRIWCPGCSSGEEPYSIAILMQECMAKSGQHVNIQIFATDINPRAIAIARAGIYPSSISSRMPAERLSRFFTKDADGKNYRISRSIRDMLIFSEQDLVLDPPFSKLDMISCRNLLIYMDINLQKKIISTFHYALKPGGILVLGPSESIGKYGTHYEVINLSLKIFSTNIHDPQLMIQDQKFHLPKVPFLPNKLLIPSNAHQTLIQASLEDMRSINEELQSSNEELETSKEELQAINEELTTVNAELQTKVVELSQVNNDMNNLLAGTGIGTLFVDLELRILRFTPAASAIINLIRSDVARPLRHLVVNLKTYTQMVPDLQSVLDTLIPKELEVESLDGRWYTMRMQPYRTLENVVEGAVITFVDISEKKQLQDALAIANQQLREAYPNQESTENNYAGPSA